ncbi:cysteine peptidase family C39 domain-containing protein [Dyella subtropica]|uniref:cysteine peptidase family C39 domain-containing protein n=1 Tax=Dyella subtropica TaxID=2992127 RepID=UPI002251B031|nr:cysteine peptidase family C39 domain-containing protein [Dyella subtropica]
MSQGNDGAGQCHADTVDTSATANSEAPSDTPPDTGILGLVPIARLHGIAADPVQLAHEFKEPGRSFDRDLVLLAAKKLGLKAKAVRSTPERSFPSASSLWNQK